MINKMREWAPAIMLVILVAFVGGTIFLDWGMNLTGRGNRMVAAGKVNGKEIPLSLFDQMVNMERQRMQEAGQEVPPQQYRMVPQQVWEREVSRRLMQDITAKMHLKATAEEVFNYIKRNPLPGIDTVSAFQTDNKFDTTKYEQFLNDPRNYEQYRWLQEIESYTASTLVPAQKLEALLRAGSLPTLSEVTFQYFKNNSKVVFEYVKAEKDSFMPDTSSITDAMVSRYFESHRDSFKVDEQADLYYVKFSKEPDETDERFYHQELLDLKARIEGSGKPIAEAFAEEAAIESDDPGTAVQGGDLDWFGREAMVGPFDSAAFTIPVGTISEPVKTTFGIHLILVEGREMRDSVLKVHARHILRKITPTIERLDYLAEQADSLRGLMLDNGFVAAAKEWKNIVFDSTGFFEKGAPVPGIGYLSGVGGFAFGKTDQVVSERLENNDGFYLVSIKRTVEKGTMPIDAAKDKIVGILKDSVALAAAKGYLEKIRNDCPDTVSIVEFVRNDSTVKSGVTDTVSGAEYIPDVGYSTPVTACALSTSIGAVSPVIEFGGNGFIVKTLWKETVDSIPPVTSPEMRQIAAHLGRQVNQRIYYEWFAAYKDKARVTSNVKDLYLD